MVTPPYDENRSRLQPAERNEDVVPSDRQPITFLAEHLFRRTAHHEHTYRVSTYPGAFGPGRLRKFRWLSPFELQIGSCPVPYEAPGRDVTTKSRAKLGSNRVVSNLIAWLLAYIRRPEREPTYPILHQRPT
jgi:hypothetical protein